MIEVLSPAQTQIDELNYQLPANVIPIRIVSNKAGPEQQIKPFFPPKSFEITCDGIKLEESEDFKTQLLRAQLMQRYAVDSIIRELLATGIHTLNARLTRSTRAALSAQTLETMSQIDFAKSGRREDSKPMADLVLPLKSDSAQKPPWAEFVYVQKGTPKTTKEST